jgi:hypothetical protein
MGAAGVVDSRVARARWQPADVEYLQVVLVMMRCA